MLIRARKPCQLDATVILNRETRRQKPKIRAEAPPKTECPTGNSEVLSAEKTPTRSQFACFWKAQKKNQSQSDVLFFGFNTTAEDATDSVNFASRTKSKKSRNLRIVCCHTLRQRRVEQKGTKLYPLHSSANLPQEDAV